MIISSHFLLASCLFVCSPFILVSLLVLVVHLHRCIDIVVRYKSVAFSLVSQMDPKWIEQSECISNELFAADHSNDEFSFTLTCHTNSKSKYSNNHLVIRLVFSFPDLHSTNTHSHTFRERVHKHIHRDTMPDFTYIAVERNNMQCHLTCVAECEFLQNENERKRKMCSCAKGLPMHLTYSVHFMCSLSFSRYSKGVLAKHVKMLNRLLYQHIWW